MTSTVSQFTTSTITSTSYDALSTSIGIIAIVLLIVLLLLKETARAFGRGRAPIWVRTLDVAIMPLLLAFTVVVVLRLLSLVRV